MNEITFVNWKNLPIQKLFTGIYFGKLWQSKVGAKAAIVKIKPSEKWQGRDEHKTTSKKIFVAGSFNDGERDYPERICIHNPIGSKHILQSDTGCILFVFYPAK